MLKHLSIWIVTLALTAAPAAANTLPAEIVTLMKKHRVPQSGVGLIVHRLDDNVSLARHQAERAFNPASVVKLVTTLAAVELLGPNYRWETRIGVDGDITNGVLDGNLYLIGGGDPLLTVERFLYILNDLRSRGLREIRGDVIIDDSIFTLPPFNPGAFDGAPLKPYNVGAGGLIVNFKAHEVVFSPTAAGINVFTEPPNLHFVVDNKIKAGQGRCRNWRGKIQERFRQDGDRIILTVSGVYPKRCGEQSFYLSVLEHPAYVAGVFGALWRRMGGEWQGGWKHGKAPEDIDILAAYESPPLSDIITAMNKHSNNVIARNLYLSLAPDEAPRILPAAAAALDNWLGGKGVHGAVIENGSGLSRTARMTPEQMATVLRHIWEHRYRAEMLASLPILGIDGTLRKRLKKGELAGAGHFKTGSLNGVKSIGGFFYDRQGRTVMVAFFSHNVRGSRSKALQDAIIRWAYEQ